MRRAAKLATYRQRRVISRTKIILNFSFFLKHWNGEPRIQRALSNISLCISRPINHNQPEIPSLQEKEHEMVSRLDGRVVKISTWNLPYSLAYLKKKEEGNDKNFYAEDWRRWRSENLSFITRLFAINFFIFQGWKGLGKVTFARWPSGNDFFRSN